MFAWNRDLLFRFAIDVKHYGTDARKNGFEEIFTVNRQKIFLFADDKSHIGRQISFFFSFSFFIEIKVGLRDLNASDFIIFDNLRRNIFSYYVVKV